MPRVCLQSAHHFLALEPVQFLNPAPAVKKPCRGLAPSSSAGHTDRASVISSSAAHPESEKLASTAIGSQNLKKGIHLQHIQLISVVRMHDDR